MPGMSGVDLAKKIRSIRNGIMIWLCTAFMVDDLFSDGDFKSAGFDLVLEKPLKLSRLKQIIETKLTPLQLK
jgi:CheY-like chemotaxis protein